MPVALAADEDLAGSPVDIVDLHGDHFGRPQPEAGEQQHHGIVAPAPGRIGSHRPEEEYRPARASDAGAVWPRIAARRSGCPEARLVAVLPAWKRYRKKFLRCDEGVLSRSGGVRVVRCCRKLAMSAGVICDQVADLLAEAELQEAIGDAPASGRSSSR